MLKMSYGEEPFLVSEKIREWLPNDLSFQYVKFDMRETSISEVLEEANTADLFSNGEDKYIVLDDCYFLTTEKSLKEDELELLTDYIENPNPTTILIFKAGKLDKRKKLVKQLMKAGENFEGKPIKYPQNWISNRAKKVYAKNLSKDAVDYIVNRLGTDLYLLDSELQKISTTYIDQDKITMEMLDGVLSRTLENDVFRLIDRVVNRMSSAMELLDDLLQMGNEPIQILLLISRQMRIIQQVKLAEHTGQNVKEFLNIHPYALQKAQEQAEMYSLEDVQEKVKELGELDLKMKRGEVDKLIALETLILKWL